MESFSCTNRVMLQFSHTWVIKSFDLSTSCDEINDLISNSFAASENSDDKFYLELETDREGIGEEDDGYLQVHLRNSIANKYTKLNAHFNICIGNVNIDFSSPLSLKSDANCIIYYRDLYEEPNKISPFDPLKIRCEVTIPVTDPVCTSENVIQVPDCKLTYDFRAILNSEEFADVKIVTGDGKEIPAHKLILSAISQVFGAMFKHPLEENQQNCVNISDYSYKVVLEMLRFIYTGCAPNLKDMTEELLSAADKYDLGRLKAMCLSFLKENLGDETAAMTLKLADLYNEEELKSYVLEYIKNNRASVLKTSSWKSFATSDKILVLESFFLLKLDE